MRKTVERLAVTAGAFVATGVAATLLKNNAQDRRKALRQDIEPFGTVRGFGTDVIADDGVAINVEVDPGPIPTVVFVHGWMCDIDTWHFQRLALRGKARMVFMDLVARAKRSLTAARSTISLTIFIGSLTNSLPPDRWFWWVIPWAA